MYKGQLRAFGSYDISVNALKIDEVISTRAEPQAVAEGIGALISAVPELVAQGKLQAQGYTNVISFLENTSQLIDCNASDVTVILLTDGFEVSEYPNLTKGGALRNPEALSPGCAEPMLLGVGQGGGGPRVTKPVADRWGAGAEGPGFRQ